MESYSISNDELNDFITICESRSLNSNDFKINNIKIEHITKQLIKGPTVVSKNGTSKSYTPSTWLASFQMDVESGIFD